ncbi:putative long chain fatty acid CoA ligase [Azoarcus olearius]|uniref:AMP-dependent synthetase/ligase n=1 Tax=Azoarcus sp. (strain BH72) TaxID=418699 RepID=UPI000806282A|nr:AMP-binding protein [Azoarcus olearius]ANQ86331.1 putative long chain fatty acid CoA ligase [Azoarcus olearius]
MSVATPPQTLPGRLRQRVSATPSAPAFLLRNADGDWQPVPWSALLERAEHLATHFVRLGVRPGDRVAIMLPTGPDWECCQYAALLAGAAVVGIDAHDAPQNLRHILAIASPALVVAPDAERLEQLRSLHPGDWHAIVQAEAPSDSGLPCLSQLTTPCEALLPEPAADDIATLVFTSGSTGKPKGIAYSHRQILLACDTILDRFPAIRDDARLVCWLPLSNLFQRMINFCALTCGARSYMVDKPDQIARLLPEIEPTLFIGVPRFFEKLYAGIRAELARQPRLVRLLVAASWSVGERIARARRAGREPALAWRMLQPLADAVLVRLRAVMGRNLQFMVSGSAPLPGWLMERFHALGWLVLEAYGISENVMPVALNTLDAYRFGSVGHPLPGNEVKIAEDRELLVRGAGVFSGYVGGDGSSPIDAEGFLHTGDYARLDEDGFVWLEGRKSEVFKSSTGRRIAPAPIEAALKQIEYVDHAVLTGSQRPYTVAILALRPDHPLSSTVHDPAAQQRITADVAAAVRDFNEYQRPGAIVVAAKPFTIADGELTANLKIRRKAIEERFADVLAQAYSRPATDASSRSAVIIAP